MVRIYIPARDCGVLELRSFIHTKDIIKQLQLQGFSDFAQKAGCDR